MIQWTQPPAVSFEKELLIMDEKNLNRKPRTDTAAAAELFDKLPTASQAAIIERMKSLLSKEAVDFIGRM